MMTRASIYIPDTLHQRLVMASKRKKINISVLARTLLDQALMEEERQQLRTMYDGLKRLKGVVKDPVTDASTTIDEVLYGENGAWRGTLPTDANPY